MKPQLLKISLRPEQSFSIRHDIMPVFYNKWHYHDEVELVYFLKGSGSQFIGHTIQHFKAGDMVLVGSNLPHMWGSGKESEKSKAKNLCESIVIHFLPDCLGNFFFSLPENKSIRLLLDKAQRGIKIKGETKEAIALLMRKLLESESTERIILLLRILTLTATSKELDFLCSKQYNFNFSLRDNERLNDIYQYIMDNYSKKIQLSDLASLANMAPNSFCRYFKSRTRKSYSKFLIEVRITHACKLLAETQKQVSDICYECGYNSFSNFNKHFLQLIKQTPLAFRKSYWEKEDV